MKDDGGAARLINMAQSGTVSFVDRLTDGLNLNPMIIGWMYGELDNHIEAIVLALLAERSKG